MSDKKEERAKPTKAELDALAEHALKERNEAIQKVLERKVILSNKYVKPHNIPGRKVEDKDIPRLLKDATFMHEMCMVGRGDYTTAYAIAHTQVEEKDPLAFYVTIEGMIIINPVIVRHTNQLLDKREGCMSYPEEPMKVVLRFNKVTVKYQTLVQEAEKEGEEAKDPVLSPIAETGYTAQQAQVVQHECSHLLGHNIYDENSSAMDAVDDTYVDKVKIIT